MRARCRSVTDQAASSSVSRAFTSTKTRSARRRATMSISPTGLFQRRARMRKPLAISSAAARLSAERPSAERDLALRPRAAADAPGWRAGRSPRHRRVAALASASAR